MARMGLRKLILSTVAAWAPEVGRMGLRRLILSTLVAWVQIWPEWASEGSF